MQACIEVQATHALASGWMVVQRFRCRCVVQHLVRLNDCCAAVTTFAEVMCSAVILHGCNEPAIRCPYIACIKRKEHACMLSSCDGVGWLCLQHRAAKVFCLSGFDDLHVIPLCDGRAHSLTQAPYSPVDWDGHAFRVLLECALKSRLVVRQVVWQRLFLVARLSRCLCHPGRTEAPCPTIRPYRGPFSSPYVPLSGHNT